jgi:hypothetical protein
MKRVFFPTPSPSVLVLLALALPGAAGRAAPRQDSPGSKAAIGELVPDFTFNEFLAGSDGRQRPAEFRGQPVLIVNWTDTDFGRGAAEAVKKPARELVPEGLVLILLDTHNKTAPEIEAAVMRLYPGSPARLQRNQKPPIEYLENGPPPNIALVGVDGTLLAAGSYTADLGKALELVRVELKKREKGWGEDKAARTARALLYGRGKLAAAKHAVEAALQVSPDHAELKTIRTEIDARFEQVTRSVRYFLDSGQALRAQEAARALAVSVEGDAEWAAQAAQLLEELESPDVARELELDRKLSSILAPLAKKNPSREADKLLELAAEAGDTRVGKRAQHLAEIVALASGE